MTSQTPVRLDELGSLQFERFCVELLGGDEEVSGADFRPWGFALQRRRGLELPNGSSLPGPALVLAVWLRDGSSAPSAVRRLERVVERMVASCDPPPRSVVLLTNAAAASGPSGVETVVFGPDELWELLRRRSALRFRLPSLLGVADLSQLVPEEAARRSSADLESATLLARVFVPTRAYAHALRVLERHRFVVLTGPPEMGKTAIARMLGLASLSDGWELHECLRPDELWRQFARDRQQLFIADDAFGSTEYRPDTAERWALELDRVLRPLDERHRLVWTSRPAPLKAALRRIHREHGVERFPAPAEVGVDAAELDAAEKALILFRHARAANLSDAAIELVRTSGWEIVSHAHFTPERIRRFVARRLPELADAQSGGDADVATAVATEIREPTTAMAASYRALAPDHRAVLLALLDTPPGPVTERELTAALRRHSPVGLERPIAEIVDRLADHFLRSSGSTAVGWVHPSWRDLVIDELAGDERARHAFLGACGIHGTALALSTAGGLAGERMLPLLRRDADWDTLADRLAALLPELQPPETTLVLDTLAESGRQAPAAAQVELSALAGETLCRLAHTWQEARTAAPVGLLAAWFSLAETLPEPPKAPLAAVAASWIELLPPEALDLTVPAHTAATDDWLTLIELLANGAPDVLLRFDFPDAQRQAFDAVLAAAAGLSETASPPEARTLVLRLLRRLARLVPELAEHVSDVSARLSYAHGPAPTPDPEPVYRELSPDLERLLRQPLTTARQDQAVVTRVLRDL